MNTLDFIAKRLNIAVNQNPLVIASGQSRYTVASLFRQLGFTAGAEIGTFDGYYARLLCFMNPQAKLTCIDPWEKNAVFSQAQKKLAGLNARLVRKSSIGAAKDFRANSLDFVFLGGGTDVRSVSENLARWMTILKPGGIIYGQNFSDNTGVKQAVLAYAAENKIKPVIILHRRKFIDSWMMVKPEPVSGKIG